MAAAVGVEKPYHGIPTSLLYADDLTLLAALPSDMEAYLRYLNSWCNNVGLSVNTDKTKIVIFRKEQRSRAGGRTMSSCESISITRSPPTARWNRNLLDFHPGKRTDAQGLKVALSLAAPEGLDRLPARSQWRHGRTG